jgi:hypothetical protein
MYYPYQKGRYEVAPGLLPLKSGEKLFEIGDDFSTFRSQFELNRSREPVSKYVCLSEGTHGPAADPAAVGAIAAFMARKLAEEYPAQVSVIESADHLEFKSAFTGDAFTLIPSRNEVTSMKGHLSYVSAWDAMGAQVPEDLAIWRLNDDGTEHLEGLHLNAPNHWAALEKVGRSFAAVHVPVAHIEKIVPWAVNLLDGILKKGPYTRFAWGVGTDSRLNHHPEAAPGVDPKEWHGRSFNPNEPKLYARVERQVLWGFLDSKRALFTIRTYFHDMEKMKAERPEAVKGLIDAIESMSPQSLAYKGLVHDKENVVGWLKCL